MDFIRGSWRWREFNGVHWLEDGFLMETGIVRQGFSGRLGGVSPPPYDSLNFSLSTGDEPEAVGENRRRLADAVGFGVASWCGLRQVHGVEVKRVGRGQAGCWPTGADGRLGGADGQVTDEAGVTLVTLHADCIPIYLVDVRRRAVGLAHAGWQGTLANMSGAAVEAMAREFGSRPRDLFASIGPGAGPCHYEVDAKVMAKVGECFAGLGRAASFFDGNDVASGHDGSAAAIGCDGHVAATERHVRAASTECKSSCLGNPFLRPSENAGKAYLDLWLANAWLLAESGVPPGQISIAGICTICEGKSLFSHRNKDLGRQAAFLALVPKNGS